jgi:hypothetical protein
LSGRRDLRGDLCAECPRTDDKRSKRACRLCLRVREKWDLCIFRCCERKANSCGRFSLQRAAHRHGGNGKYLFGAGAGFVNIFSYSIAPNGALKQVSSINAQKFTLDNCGAVLPPLFLDHTGTDLYALSFLNDCANNAYQFFRVNKSTVS